MANSSSLSTKNPSSMAEENIDALLGIEEPSHNGSKNKGVFDNMPDEPNTVDPFSASKGLKNASTVCQVFLWIGIVLAVIGGLVFLANIGDASEDYSWSAKYQARCAAGSACFIYGVVGALSSYVFSKILIGLSVMTKASEKYLHVNK